MKKKICFLLALLMCLGSVMPALAADSSFANDGYDYMLFNYSSFAQHMGSWVVNGESESIYGQILRSQKDKTLNTTVNAEALFVPQKTGTYYVWARSVDFDVNPGSRRFLVGINNGFLPGFAGDLGKAGWGWSLVGSVSLTAGITNKLTVCDFTNCTFSRLDSIVVTDNPNFEAPEKDKVQSELGSFLVSGSGLTYDGRWDGANYYYDTASLYGMGTWSYANQSLSDAANAQPFSKNYVIGKTNRNTSGNTPAVIYADIDEPGEYTMWVRCGIPDQDSTKSRSFKIAVNNVQSGSICNYTGTTGFFWENAGKFNLKDGVNTIYLIDYMSYFARFDAIAFSKDDTCPPPSVESAISRYATKMNSVYSTPTSEGALSEFPSYALQDAETLSTAQIGNDNVTVNFYNVRNDGGTFVQNDVYYKGDKLKNKTDTLGRILMRYGGVSLNSQDRGSPVYTIEPMKPFNVAENDWQSDSAWGVGADKTWTNMGVLNPDTVLVEQYVGETITVPLYIPKSGYYYGITRGAAFQRDNKRGYTVSVNGSELTTNGSTHYFNVTNNDTFGGRFTFSYNTDPVYLEQGEVTVSLTSQKSGQAMRTSFFTLVPAENTAEVESIISKLTSFNAAVSMLGGDAITDYFGSEAPRTTTGYPYPITYDYVSTVKGNNLKSTTRNVYGMGDGEWLVPKTAVQSAENEVTVTYESEYATVTEVWSIEDGDEEPRVNMTVTAKRNGCYSVIIPSHGSYAEDEYEYGFAPMQYRGHGFPKEPLLITEQYMFTPMVSVSLPKDNSVVPGKEITYGYTVEPSWIPLRWVYRDDYKFGAVMRAPSSNGTGKIAPSLIAGAQGSPDSALKVGQSYDFSFRPIYRTGDWYDSFSHVAHDLFNVRDYRQNYYSSVTDAILNTSDLMMDDEAGGWDANGMGHWNMEGNTIASNSTPLEAVQRFMLTDDDSILRERAIPTIISTLTRNSHFKWNTTQGGAVTNYVGENLPSSVGKRSGYFGATVLEGFDQMAHGAMPYTSDLATSLAHNISSDSNQANYISDLVSMYKSTNDESYLIKAKSVADNYLVEMKNTIQSESPIYYSSFAYISFMPFISGLIDIYSVTGEQKYLDAAEYAGKVILTLVCSVGIDGDKAERNMDITKEYLCQRGFMLYANFWWHGEVQWRLGTKKGEPGRATDHPLQQKGFDKLQDETVPAWVPSRVGIGLEQPSTFYGESLNMIMSNWAADMLRLAEYTGDDTYEAAARNAIIGRFANYSGYYVNRFVTYQMKADYPYDSPVDFTSVYWHHIPPFLSMLEDFVITQAWKWSNRQIDFPSVRQQGYAYFNNNQYGFASGRFFNEKDMWLWIDKDVVTTSSVQADWIAARKDGVMGVALMNEQKEPLSVTVTLGNKADSTYSGIVTLYAADGSVSQTTAENGVFTVTIPAHSLVGAVIDSAKIKAPSFANTYYTQSEEANAALKAKHTDITGEGTVLQLSPGRYFAHVYVTDKPDSVSKIRVEYTLGDSTETQVMEDSLYPYEIVAEVTDVTKPFNYKVKTYDADGSLITESKTYSLTPLKSYEVNPQENNSTLLITGKNVKQKLTGTGYNFINIGTDYILQDYGMYSTKQITETPTVTVSVPEDGNYYIYANMRAGHATYPQNRLMTLSVTQNGEAVSVNDKDGSAFQFGYSNDFKALGNEILTDDFFYNGMGFRTPNSVALKKGRADITFHFTPNAGFDFVLITKDRSLINMLENCRYNRNYTIYKFRTENSALKSTLLSYVDMDAPAAPEIERTACGSNKTGICIKINDFKNKNANYIVYVNNTVFTTVSKADLGDEGIFISDVQKGDKVTATVLDAVGNESAHSNVLTVDSHDIWYPQSFAQFNSGTNFASAEEARKQNAPPNGFTLMMTQNNFSRLSVAGKADTNLFSGQKDNYYSSTSQNFVKAFEGKFVIPEGSEDTEYQFISSYLRAVNYSKELLTDSRRTQFLLIDGKALTKDGLVDWNGETSYNGTDNYGTNAYVFGSEYPHEFTPSDDPTNVDELFKNYPHNQVGDTAHMWGYSPIIKLSPGLHSVEVYCVGGTNWFNDLIITFDVNYDISKLFFVGLPTRGTGWVNNFNKVAKPLYTDYTAPVFSSNAAVSIENNGNLGKLSWTEATDVGLGATPKNICYVIELKDANNNVTRFESMTNSLNLSGLDANKSYTVSVKAYDSAGNASSAITGTVTTYAPSVVYNKGTAESSVTFYPENNDALLGECSVFIASFNKSSERLISIDSKSTNVAFGAENKITFDTPNTDSNAVYKIFVWKTDSLKPLLQYVTP